MEEPAALVPPNHLLALVRILVRGRGVSSLWHFLATSGLRFTLSVGPKSTPFAHHASFFASNFSSAFWVFSSVP
ncbi:MAG: hypothetical protein HYW48_10680 [Deltaproteobacteria bacterium]|nr:hypothetical protein [Deltaproteobacteria bacterium]